MQSGLKSAYESIKAFSETDFTEDLMKIDVPTLVMHGEDDQIFINRLLPFRSHCRSRINCVGARRAIKGDREVLVVL